jgi:GGDEF domain-containing protein
LGWNWRGGPNKAHQRHGDNEREMKEITSAVARMAESLSQRDERCSREIGSLTDQLRSIAGLNDVTAIRRSVLEGARALRTCVEQMVDEGRKSVAKLTSEVADYRARLEETQCRASLDSLTGLANRRTFEAHLQERIRASSPFSLILIDLDEFRRVNDCYGHMPATTF